eukprot:TRINITY_DN4072_c1_g1_i3.p1 TRINITY_DN4072_c1_g1~~TRINITY_DN4072_c1_g1_i3.p1  ORF type:complete len:687 (+),score=111.46 TRINITY_DN4072_c1_g1_i3:253-2313(+)
MSGVRVKKVGKGKDAEELFSQVFMAWLKDTRETMTTERAKMFREVFDKGVTEKEFTMRTMRLGINTAIAIAQALLRVPLQKLDLCENFLRDSGVESLGSLIKDSAHLTHLNLGGNDIGHLGMVHLSMALQAHKRIQVLILGSSDSDTHANKIGPISGKALGDAVRKNKSLKVLDLSRNPLGSGGDQEAFKMLTSACDGHHSLTTLRLGSTNLASESATELIQKLMLQNSIQELCLQGNDLGPSVAETAAKCFQDKAEKRQRISLQRLDFHDNPRLGERGTSPLFNSLCYVESHVTLLNMRNTGVTDDAVLCLANALKYSTSLQTVNLSSNHITELGCMALAQQLESNVSVTFLSLSGNKIRCEGVVALASTLETNSYLVTLELDSTRLSDQGTIALGVSLAANTSLEYLKLTSNHISDEAGKAFCSLLDKNRTVQNILIKGNQVDHATLARLKKMLKRNKQHKENEIPNKLHKEVIRLHYQRCKLQEANHELTHHQKARTKLQEEMDSYDARLLQEREDTEKKSQELLEKVRREEQELHDISQKKVTKEKDFVKFQEDVKIDIARLSERLEEEIKRRETAEVALSEKREMLNSFLVERAQEKERLEAEVARVRTDTEKYLSQAEDMLQKQRTLDDVLAQLESIEKEKIHKEADRKTAAEHAKVAKREKARKKKEEEQAAAELLFSS